MDLKSIGQELAKLGLPLIGAALPVPGGAAIGAQLAALIGGDGTPAGVLAAVKESADKLEAAKQFELTHQETLLRIQVDAEQKEMESVNATMRAEASADHWPTYSWRPFVGFVFGVMILGDYFVIPLLQPSMKGLAVPDIPGNVWLAIGGILGAASWFRGKGQADGTLDPRG